MLEHLILSGVFEELKYGIGGNVMEYKEEIDTRIARAGSGRE